MTTKQQDPETAAPRETSVSPSLPRRPRPSVSMILEQYGLVIFLVALIVFFAVWPKTSQTFLTSANIRTTLENQAVVTIAALGALIPFIAGQFDLTVGANGIVSTFIVAALTTKAGVPAGVSCIIAVLAGAGIGAASGIVVAYLRASAIVITLGMATLLGGLVILYSKSNSITGIPTSLISFGAKNWLGVPRPLWLTLVVLLLVGYLLRATVTGRRLLMIGENPVAATLVGVRTQRLILLAFILGGALYGVAGVVLLANTGSASPSDGFSNTFQVLTAVFLGATTVRPGRFNVLGTIVGVLFIAVSVDGLSLAGASDWVQPVFTGAAVIVAVAASTVFARRRVT
jgi:ribose transport system permease protein